MAAFPPPGIGPSPPGLWQPPGLGGGPPSVPPPPAPVDAGANGAAAGEVAGAASATAGRETDLQEDIAGTIKAQVHRLIKQAQQDTTSKVQEELKTIRVQMATMEAALDKMLVQLDTIQPKETAEAPLDAEKVGELLLKIEQQWGQEIRMLKQELHQTILAHNHNADLIKHHKDTIDSLRERCNKITVNSLKTPEIQQQLQRLDAQLKQQAKTRKLEPLFERLTALEQRVQVATAGSGWAGYPGMRSMGLPGMHGMTPAMLAQMGGPAAAAALMAGKGAAAGEAGAGEAAKAAPEKVGFKPTDEEVQARLSKVSAGAKGAATEPQEEAEES